MYNDANGVSLISKIVVIKRADIGAEQQVHVHRFMCEAYS